jgi:ADP-ribose pyrophosphatase YjhB (NUDIX family)
MKHYHPLKNDQGQQVALHKPSTPSDMSDWANPTQLATVVPAGPMPDEVGKISVCSWTDAPHHPAGWETLADTSDFVEPPFKVKSGKRPASGAVVVEPDGRVWVISPSNEYAGYKHTFPKGTIYPSDKISLRANALKEVFEESGLQVELYDFLADSERSQTTTRYYLARRIGGNPADMGWESQAVHLVPRAQLTKVVTHANDAVVLQALDGKRLRQLERQDLLITPTLDSATRIFATVMGFRREFGYWPTRLQMESDMADAIQSHVLTPIGWNMLIGKMQLMRVDAGPLIAEGGASDRFEYGSAERATYSDGRADVWIWGMKLAP